MIAIDRDAAGLAALAEPLNRQGGDVITFVTMDQLDAATGSIVNIPAGAARTGGLNPSASCAGPIDTPMLEQQARLPGRQGDGKASIVAAVPLGLDRPADIAHGVLFLASGAKPRYSTGEILDSNDGLVMD